MIPEGTIEGFSRMGMTQRKATGCRRGPEGIHVSFNEDARRSAGAEHQRQPRGQKKITSFQGHGTACCYTQTVWHARGQKRVSVDTAGLIYQGFPVVPGGFFRCHAAVEVARAQSDTIVSSTGRGTAPFSRTTSWNLRRSNFDPSCFFVFSRNSRILFLPIW